VAQPNPNAIFVQIFSSAAIASRLLADGLVGVDPLQDIQKLISLNDPVLKRLGYCISIAGPKYATAMAKPLGYYACIAIHNGAIDDKWDGGSADNPYGTPDVAA